MAHPIGPLNFILLHASDIAQARAFYVDALGMAVEAETLLFLQVTASRGPELSLGISHAESVTITGRALWWQVDDIDSLRARLVRLGVRITAEPQDEPFGRTLSFTDPEGNILSAFQPK
jgi:predicted enzyme related to lactoylglutathione lyase